MPKKDRTVDPCKSGYVSPLFWGAPVYMNDGWVAAKIVGQW